MKVIQLKGITKKESPLHYRGEYSGTAVLDLEIDQPIESRLTFVLEHSATGGIGVTITLLDDVNYPLVPLIGSLKSFILSMEKEGRLS